MPQQPSRGGTPSLHKVSEKSELRKETSRRVVVVTHRQPKSLQSHALTYLIASNAVKVVMGRKETTQAYVSATHTLVPIYKSSKCSNMLQPGLQLSTLQQGNKPGLAIVAPANALTANPYAWHACSSCTNSPRTRCQAALSSSLRQLWTF